MKKQYISPLTEVVDVRTYRLLQDGTDIIKPDPNPAGFSYNDDIDARGTDFLEDEGNGEGGFGYRRYNLWDR